MLLRLRMVHLSFDYLQYIQFRKEVLLVIGVESEGQSYLNSHFYCKLWEEKIFVTHQV